MIPLTKIVLTFLLNIRFNTAQPISRIITGRYGPRSLQSFRSLENINRKLTKAELDHQYLKCWKAYNIFPNFLKFKLYRHSLTTTDWYKELQRKLLDNEIRTKERLIQHHRDNLATLDSEFKDHVIHVDYQVLSHFISEKMDKFRLNTQLIHERKLNSLGARLHLTSCHPEQVLFNLSSRLLSQREQFLLSFGLDFNLPLFKLSFFKYFLSVEKLLATLKDCSLRTDFNFDRIIQSIKSVCFTTFYKFKSNNVFSPIFTKADFILLKSLGRDRNIVVCPPDKGRGVVILDRSDYVSKMETILKDSTKFERLPHADSFLLSVRLEDRINKFLKTLNNANVISDATYKYLYVTGSSPGILYGLAKIHKTGIPFRPILAAYKTATYKIAKFLIPLIEPFAHNEYTVKNSYEFYDSVLALNNSNMTGFMVSYDVSSLYTNVPVNETLSILCDQIFSVTDNFHNFSRDNFLGILRLAVSNSYFLFNNFLYKQLDGLAMGNPLAPALANVFLCDIERKIFTSCPVNIRPKFYRRYLDDTFAIFDNEDQADSFFHFINALHSNLSFSMDKQVQCKLPFLDLNIDNSSGIFSSSVYRKATFTGLGMSFF